MILEDELKQLEERFLSVLKQFDRLSQVEKIQLAAQLDFFKELEDLGLTKIIGVLERDYAQTLSELGKQKLGGISPTTYQDLEMLLELDADSILRRAQAYSSEFKSALIKGFVAGEDTETIRLRLGDIGLASNQTIAAINTARDEFNATALSKLFEDEPETRFKLSDFPLDDRTRCSCRAVITHQPEEGWTKEEIDNGAATKIALKYCPKFEGKYGFVNRGGFNCRHVWEIV